MRFAFTPVILALIIGTLLAGCGSKPASNSPAPSGQTPANPNAARTSVEELGLIINMPFEAEDAFWKEDKTRKKLTAVLRFDSIDTGKIVAEAEKVRPPEQVVVPAETWFPPDLTVDSDARGVDEIAGKAYAADQFFHGEYTQGRLVRVEGNDYFILELRTN